MRRLELLDYKQSPAVNQLVEQGRLARYYADILVGLSDKPWVTEGDVARASEKLDKLLQSFA